MIIEKDGVKYEVVREVPLVSVDELQSKADSLAERVAELELYLQQLRETEVPEILKQALEKEIDATQNEIFEQDAARCMLIEQIESIK